MATAPNMRLAAIVAPATPGLPAEAGEGMDFLALLTTGEIAADPNPLPTLPGITPEVTEPVSVDTEEDPDAAALLASLLGTVPPPPPRPTEQIPGTAQGPTGAPAVSTTGNAPQSGAMPIATDPQPAQLPATPAAATPVAAAPASTALPQVPEAPKSSQPAAEPAPTKAPALPPSVLQILKTLPTAKASTTKPAPEPEAPPVVAAFAAPQPAPIRIGRTPRPATEDQAPAQDKPAQPEAQIKVPPHSVTLQPQAEVQPAELTQTTTAPVQTAGTQAAPAPLADLAVERQLDVAADGLWLDQLARDIVSTGGSEGTMRFRLNPEQLGELRVEIQQGDEGASVRLTADNETARTLIADAQPRLVAEARAQGVRIAETHVDLSQGGGAGGQSRGDEQAAHGQNPGQPRGNPANPRSASSETTQNHAIPTADLRETTTERYA